MRYVAVYGISNSIIVDRETKTIEFISETSDKAETRKKLDELNGSSKE